MAAGLTIASKDLAKFKQMLLIALEQTIDPSVLQQDYLSDGELDATDISLELAECLPTAAPWGQTFPEPQFHGQFTVESVRVVGQQRRGRHRTGARYDSQGQ